MDFNSQGSPARVELKSGQIRSTQMEERCSTGCEGLLQKLHLREQTFNVSLEEAGWGGGETQACQKRETQEATSPWSSCPGWLEGPFRGGQLALLLMEPQQMPSPLLLWRHKKIRDDVVRRSHFPARRRPEDGWKDHNATVFISGLCLWWAWEASPGPGEVSPPSWEAKVQDDHGGGGVNLYIYSALPPQLFRFRDLHVRTGLKRKAGRRRRRKDCKVLDAL